MKNKLLLILLALVCVISCVFALVACDLGGKPNNPNGNGNTDGDTIIGMEVTAEQWSEILDGVNNFMLEMTKDGKFYGSVKFDGVKRHLLTDFDEEEIYNKDDDSRYCYVKAGESKWYLIKGSYDDYAHLNLLGEFADYYTQFTYSDGTYVAQSVDRTNPDNKTYSNAKAVFANGTLVSMELDVTTSWEDTETSNTIKYTYKDVGKVTITIPTDIIGDDDKPNPDTAQVTEEQWEEILCNVDNFTVEAYIEDQYYGQGKIDGYTVNFTNDSSEGFYTKQGDNYYSYYYSDDVWVKREISETSYLDSLGFSMQLTTTFKDYYDRFEFKNDTYSLDYLDKKEVSFGMDLKNIKIVFEKGSLVSLEVEVISSSTVGKYVVHKVDTTIVELPEEYVEAIPCPIEQGAKVVMPIGTKISAFYEQYPTLITDDGKWELYVDINGEWRKMTDNDAVPYEKQFVCKLVFNGEAVVTPNDVLFFIVGTQGVVDPTPSGSQVTEEYWAKIIEETSCNYTFDFFVNDKLMQTTKIDGDKRSQENNTAKVILVKDGDKYYNYTQQDGSDWTKSNLTEEDYEKHTGNYVQFIGYFKDDYSAFTYADGVYFAETLDKTDTMNGVLENVTIAFKNNSLISIEFEVQVSSSKGRYEIKDIGNTAIEIPADYVDQTAD